MLYNNYIKIINVKKTTKMRKIKQIKKFNRKIITERNPKNVKKETISNIRMTALNSEIRMF